MQFRTPLSGCLLLAVCISPLSLVGQVTISSSDQGFFGETPYGFFHDSDKQTYDVGRDPMTNAINRAFSIFEIPTFPTALTNATFRAWNPADIGFVLDRGYVPGPTTGTLNAWDYGGDISLLDVDYNESEPLDEPKSVFRPIMEDLSTGTIYGSTLVSEALDGSWVEIDLTGALSDLSSSQGSSWAVGLAMEGIGNGTIFYLTDFDGAPMKTELVLKFENGGVIPEPSTYALILGGACLGLMFWRKTRGK